MSLKPLTGAKRLRELLKDPKKLVLCPGVYDGLTARLALATGFDAIYMVYQTPKHKKVLL
jgi:2-methylisocitrate lyase-like PEP mutase family enzyme